MQHHEQSSICIACPTWNPLTTRAAVAIVFIVAVLTSTRPAKSQEIYSSTSIDLLSQTTSNELHFQAASRVNSMNAASSLQQLYSALVAYQLTHSEKLPEKLSDLYFEGYVTDPCLFYHALDTDDAPTTINNDDPNGINSAQISFEYLVSGLNFDSLDPDQLILIDNTPANNLGMGRWAVTAAGWPEFIPDSTHRFATGQLELGPCADATIRRGSETDPVPYDLSLPDDMHQIVSVSPYHTHFLLDGSISDDLLQVFRTEAFSDVNRVINDAYTIYYGNAALSGPGTDAQPVTFYAEFETTLSIPISHLDTSAGLSMYLQSPAIDDERAHIFATSQRGLLAWGDINILESQYIAPVQGGASQQAGVYIRGIAQMSIPLSMLGEGDDFLQMRLSATSSRSVDPTTTPGLYSRNESRITLPVFPDLNFVKVYVPRGFQLHYDGMTNDDTVFFSALRGDDNLDGEIDRSDAMAFADAFTGAHDSPGYTHATFEELQTFDFDGDADIDCDDFVELSNVWSSEEDQPDFTPCQPPIRYIILQVEGQGAVEFDSSKNAYPHGTVEHLTAQANTGWEFVGWGGDLSGNDPQATITMDANKHVTAIFRPQCVLPQLTEKICQPESINETLGVGMVATRDYRNVVNQLFDRFTPSETTNVEFIRWWGAYKNFAGQSTLADDDFTIRIFEGDNDSPRETPIATFAVGADVLRNATGSSMREFELSNMRFRTYEYVIGLPSTLTLLAGQSYWISISNNVTQDLNGIPAIWSWTASNQGDQYAYVKLGDAPGEARTYDHAFCLLARSPLIEDDCNANGMNDTCDIQNDPDLDADKNGILDECQECVQDSDCEDAFLCTTESCNTATGQCVRFTDDRACDDSLWCNGSETCSIDAGCQPGTPVVCDDGIDCTIDSCDENRDICTSQANHSACDNSEWCDGVETCSLAEGCQPGTPVVCDDDSLCTTDSCNEGNDECDFIPIVCDDLIACTIDDCDPQIGCTVAPDHGYCQDGVFCNGEELCDVDTGCDTDVPPVDCDDGFDCTIDTCNEGSDSCDHTPDDSACGDGLYCNGAEQCDPQSQEANQQGCIAGDDPCPDSHEECDEVTDECYTICLIDDDCDHLDSVCTEGVCDVSFGECVTQNINESGDCDDGDACTTSDVCTSGECLGEAIVCDDEDACTTDACQAGDCVFTPLDCDDGDACTDDSCSLGECIHQPIDLDCDDGDPCTDDVCQGGACVNIEVACPLGQACDEGVCRETCTLDADCDDAAFCNGAESCVDGFCEPGTAPCSAGQTCEEASDSCVTPPPPPECTVAEDCDDQNECTTDACNGGQCSHTNNTIACDDEDPCTSDDACSAGACSGTEIADCVICDTNDDCDDGLFCNGDETCAAAGICQDGTAPCTGQNEVCNEQTDECDVPVIEYTLTVTIQGQGTVDPTSGTFAEGTVVTLTAQPNAGWLFSNWGGSSVSGTNPVMQITMSQNRTVVALFATDSDGDGIRDSQDNCPQDANADQEDADLDQVGDVCDSCPDNFNPAQTDDDDDEVGNACDNCPNDFNPNQVDADLDGIGDACDGSIVIDNTNENGILPENTNDNVVLNDNQVIVNENGEPQPIPDTCGLCGNGAPLASIFILLGLTFMKSRRRMTRPQ